MILNLNLADEIYKLSKIFPKTFKAAIFLWLLLPSLWNNTSARQRTCSWHFFGFYLLLFIERFKNKLIFFCFFLIGVVFISSDRLIVSLLSQASLCVNVTHMYHAFRTQQYNLLQSGDTPSEETVGLKVIFKNPIKCGRIAKDHHTWTWTW